MKKHKRGNAILDSATILVVVVVLALIAFIMYQVMTSINIDIQDSEDYGSTAKAISSDSLARYPSNWDSAIIFVAFMFWVVSLILGFQIDSHPVFFIATVIGLVLILVCAMAIENFFTDFSTDSDFSYRVQFPKVSWLVDHIVIVILVMGFSIAVVVHSKL